MSGSDRYREAAETVLATTADCDCYSTVEADRGNLIAAIQARHFG